MDNLNKHDNRAHRRAAVEEKYSAYLPSIERRSFSADENQRVEVHVPTPQYNWSKTVTSGSSIADQAEPNGTPPPAEDTWDFKGYMGGHGYVELDAAETVDIELWCRDQQNGKWFKVSTIATVSALEEFRFDDEVRSRTIWLRLLNIGAAIRNITLRFSPE